MPWKETDTRTEQVRFIEQWLMGRDTVSDLCLRFGISRKTGHKRIRRYLVYGFDGLLDRSRAPYCSPHKTAEGVEKLIISSRLKHPTWGPKKLVAWLGANDPSLNLPAASTVGEVLKRSGLITVRKRRRGGSVWAGGAREADVPGRVWCADLKGWFETSDGTRCDPFTLTDASSRYLLACQNIQKPWGSSGKKLMERAFREHGLPEAIRTDNGAPFASTSLGGLSELSAWWVKLGIVPERIERGHPEQNGRHERMHRTLKAETATPPKASERAQQRGFDRFRKEYNDERPHEALGQRTPQSVHRPSPRPYPTRIPELEYPQATQVRRVRSSGEIKWKGGKIFLSTAIKGEPIGLEQEDEHLWAIMFGPLHIGTLDDSTGKVLKTPVNVLPMSPV